MIMCQWCHGAPGLSFACIKAYELWHDAKYLQVARESAEVVWQRGLLKKGSDEALGRRRNVHRWSWTVQWPKSHCVCASHVYAPC